MISLWIFVYSFRTQIAWLTLQKPDYLQPATKRPLRRRPGAPGSVRNSLATSDPAPRLRASSSICTYKGVCSRDGSGVEADPNQSHYVHQYLATGVDRSSENRPAKGRDCYDRNVVLYLFLASGRHRTERSRVFRILRRCYRRASHWQGRTLVHPRHHVVRVRRAVHVYRELQHVC